MPLGLPELALPWVPAMATATAMAAQSPEAPRDPGAGVQAQSGVEGFWGWWGARQREPAPGQLFMNPGHPPPCLFIRTSIGPKAKPVASSERLRDSLGERAQALGTPGRSNGAASATYRAPGEPPGHSLLSQPRLAGKMSCELEAPQLGLHGTKQQEVTGQRPRSVGHTPRARGCFRDTVECSPSPTVDLFRKEGGREAGDVWATSCPGTAGTLTWCTPRLLSSCRRSPAPFSARGAGPAQCGSHQ